MYAKVFTFILTFVCLPFMAQSNIDQKIEKLLTQMTLEEKIGQMNQYSSFWNVTGPAPQQGNAKEKYEHLKQGLVGSMLNVNGVAEAKKLQTLVVENSRLGIPLIFGFDVIHGHRTLAPIPLAEAASWDLKAIEQSARVAATEAAAMGINWTFAPMVDISRDARWGRVMEGAGEDPFLGSAIAKARVHGFQGDDLSAHNTIAACAKHFAAYGFPQAGREYNTVDIGTTTLYNMVLPPFKAAVDAQVKTFMNAFNTLNGIPATGDEFLLRDILKGEWGFQGFVVSDWESVKEMVNHGYAENNEHAAVLAANAGCDMDMQAYAYLQFLKKAVEDGRVSEDKINDAVRRILRVKFELGLFDDPYRYLDEQREKELIYHPDHQKVVLEMAKKSMVLLKNEKSLLPLDSKKKIAIMGDLANDNNSPLGGWRTGSENNTGITILEGFKNQQVDFKYAAGPKSFIDEGSFTQEVIVNDNNRTGWEEAIQTAKSADVVVMVLGEHGFMSGEARSRTQLGLPGLQQEFLEAVYAVNPNIVLVLLNGRPLTITWANEHIPAILEAWQPGTQGGNAIAEVLLGKYNPSGKLPMTFPRSVGQVPIFYNHLNTGRPINHENNVFWTHYMDQTNAPLYPFGYGLSYTTFNYSNLKIVQNQKNITVSATITNSGEMDGEEVVQLYIRDRVASIARPVKELKGFKKIFLKSGEIKSVSFTLTEKELGFFNPKGKWTTETGWFDVMIGTNSQEGLSGEFELGE